MTDARRAPPVRRTRVLLYAELMAGVVVLPADGAAETADGVRPDKGGKRGE